LEQHKASELAASYEAASKMDVFSDQNVAIIAERMATLSHELKNSAIIEESTAQHFNNMEQTCAQISTIHTISTPNEATSSMTSSVATLYAAQFLTENTPPDNLTANEKAHIDDTIVNSWKNALLTDEKTVGANELESSNLNVINNAKLSMKIKDELEAYLNDTAHTRSTSAEVSMD
jgi:hypothetical protein